MNQNSKCATCSHWRSMQACLNMGADLGLCFNPNNEFNTETEPAFSFIRLDEKNKTHPVVKQKKYFAAIAGESISPDKHLLVTRHDAGCIHHHSQ